MPARRDADIAVEREKQQKAEAREREERQQEIARQKKLQLQKELQAQKKADAVKLAEEKKRDVLKKQEEEKKQDLAKAAAATKAAEAAKATKAAEATKAAAATAAARQKEEARLEAQRQDNLRRMQDQAGPGAADSNGAAPRASGPSESYGGRIRARVRPNIVFTDDIAGNPTAEVEVRVAPDGTITSRKIVKSSGVKSWDEAVLRALDRTEVLPRDVDGRVHSPLVIEFRPKS